MTLTVRWGCPMADACMAPRCKGKDYTGSSKAKADVEAFTAEVVDFMRKNNRRDVGKVAALVMKDANAAPCMFS